MLRKAHLAPSTTALLLAFVASSPAATACPNEDKLLEHMIEAHGGMEAWAMAPTVSWEDEFVPAGGDSGLVSQVTVEQGQRRAYLDYPGTDMSIAWDGERAWSRNWSLPQPPRFMALLNYHFLNLPWLAADPGVVMSEFGRATLPNDDTEYFTVKLTYEDGVGDTPRDYYKLYIYPDSHRLKACEYIVTYRDLLPEGVTQSPANTLVFTEYAEVGGLVMPTAYTIYRDGGEVYGQATIRDWSFTKPFETARMEPASDAVEDTSQP